MIGERCDAWWRRNGYWCEQPFRDTNDSDSVGASRATRSRARDTVERGVRLLERSVCRTQGDAEALPCMNHYCKAGPSLMIAETRTLERCNGIESCHWNSTLCGSLPTSRATIWTIGTGTYHQVQDGRGKTFSRSLTQTMDGPYHEIPPWSMCSIIYILMSTTRRGTQNNIIFYSCKNYFKK